MSAESLDERMEEEVPGLPGSVAARLFGVLSEFIGPEFLSFGGGTVLAARWNHRLSLDVDLFCDPNAYGSLGAAGLGRLEAAIKAIPGCAEEPTWCDSIGTYAEIDGLEATVLPRNSSYTASTPPTRLAGTGLTLQSSAWILHAKITGRMYGALEIATRDTYDLACAKQFDLPALQDALARIVPWELHVVSELIRRLPRGWSRDSVKPLLEPCFEWNEQELKENVLAALGIPLPEPDDGGFKGNTL